MLVAIKVNTGTDEATDVNGHSKDNSVSLFLESLLEKYISTAVQIAMLCPTDARPTTPSHQFISETIAIARDSTNALMELRSQCSAHPVNTGLCSTDGVTGPSKIGW